MPPREALEAELARLEIRMDELSKSELSIATAGWSTTPASREILFAALEKTRMPMILTDPNQADDPIVFTNRAFQALSGYTAAELLGRNCRFLQGPGTKPEHILEIRDALRNQRDLAIEILNYRKDGSAFYNELYITYVYSNDGQLIYHFGSQVNVSSLRQELSASTSAEANLRSLNKRLEHDINERTNERDKIWTLISDLFMLGTFDGEIIHVNPAWQTVLGHDITTLPSQSLWGLLHQDSGSAMRDAMDEMRAGRTVRFESRIQDANGDFRWFEWAGVPDNDRFYAVARDITEQKEIVAALAAAKQAAEQAKVEAESANQAKTEFLASMSHEIRTPLHGVLGYADILRKARNLTIEQSEQLARLRSAGSALLTIVNDILDFAKIEAGQIELEYQPFSLRVLIDNAISIVRSLAAAKHVTLTVDIEPTLEDWRIGDEDRLRQVMLNLLNNAVKFTPGGAVTATIKKARSQQDDDTLYFAVTDTGIGIPASKMDRLFERFSQVDGSIRRDFGGTGLGLAICKKLVELMSGTINVISEVGQGSTFFFEIPLPTAAGDDMTHRGSENNRGRPSDGINILVVDDVEMNREIAHHVLVHAGHVVDLAANGAEAIKAVQEKAFDVVLMDIQMPEMDGMTATEHIRALRPPASRVPVIAMTANVLPHQIDQFRAVGLDDYVGKPFKDEELIAVVERWRRPVWRPKS